MRRLIIQKSPRWRLLVLLLLASFAVSACSLIAQPEEETQPIYEGVPVVSIAAPQPNDSYYEGVGVNILVRVENAGPDIARVVIKLDGQIIGEALVPNSGGAPSFVVTNSWTAIGVGAHTIDAVASRNDGTSSNPVQVPINIVAAPQSSTGSQSTTDNQTTTNTIPPTQVPPTTTGDTQIVQDQPTTIAPTNTVVATNPPEATDPPPPTTVPATDTPSRPQIRVVTGANIRSGAGTNFQPPIGSLAAGAVEDLLARHPSGQWYKIRYYNGEGWIFADTVEVIGDIATIPVESGPPTPVPFTPTPVSTATPVAVADLSIVSSSTVPEFECGNASEIMITVSNSGTGNSEATRIVVEDLFNGAVGAQTEANIGSLAPGQSQTVTLYLTVFTNVFEGHTSRFRIDPDNLVTETNENNNADQRDYVLGGGSC
ncbi:MAG: CARDB domain-containing protein [Anaerolineae bacterium]|nr:CARDB domain-containing protein [Anaerolineae bacterium]